MGLLKQSQGARLAIVLTVLLVVVVAMVFIAEFVIASQSLAFQKPEDADYTDIVDQLIAIGDPQRGEELVNVTYECHVCHVQGANKTAPAYMGLSERAQNHSPLSVSEYIYESLVYPGNFIVEGYSNAMPQNYGSRLTEQEIADILVYLLTQ